MIKKIYSTLIFLSLAGLAYGGFVYNPQLSSGFDMIQTVEEEDGSPTVPAATIIKVPNTSLTDNADGTVSLDFGVMTEAQDLDAVLTIGAVADTESITLTTGDIYAGNINYNEGMLADPTIEDAAGVTIAIGEADCLIRSDAIWNDGKLYRKTVSANATLDMTDDAINYVYVYYNSGTPIYVSTTNRGLINNSNYLPVARVAMESGDIEYQMTYKYIGKGATVRNFDRVMRTRGNTGIERESGFGISETATRVVNIASGFAWFGLNRITSDTLGAIAQGGAGVVSELWYHEATTGDWVHTTITAYDNTHYDDVVAPYGLQTLTNTSRYAVNWIFRNVTTDEIDIVLGTGDDTLAQAEASELPAIPDAVANFYVLCGRIIVKKSADTATAIENVSTTVFAQAAVSSHPDLSTLEWTTAGHTGNNNDIAGFGAAGEAIEIDTFTEINSAIADKTLINEEDAITLDSLLTASAGINITTDGLIVGDGQTVGATTNKWLFDDTNGDISTTGNVGIGTTSPLSKLSINGGLHVGGDSDAGDNNILADGTITGSNLSGTNTGDQDLSSYATLDSPTFTTAVTLPIALTGVIRADSGLVSVDTDVTDLVDDIAVSQLADGTDGNLITWDASGEPAVVATGDATQVLTSNGVGTAPTFQDASGGGGGASTALDNLASVAINESLISDTDNTDDLGSDAKQWKDLYINGTANIDSLVADTADINAGTFDGVVGGTTPAAGSFTTITGGGYYTNTSQPCFSAEPTSNQDDIAINGYVTLVMGTEVFDIGGNFASNTFTAPVTGKYQLNLRLQLENVDSAATFYEIGFYTSNRVYNTVAFSPGSFSSDADYQGFAVSVVADMDTNDTAYTRIYQGGGTSQTDIDSNSQFSGALLN